MPYSLLSLLKTPVKWDIVDLNISKAFDYIRQENLLNNFPLSSFRFKASCHTVPSWLALKKCQLKNLSIPACIVHN